MSALALVISALAWATSAAAILRKPDASTGQARAAAPRPRPAPRPVPAGLLDGPLPPAWVRVILGCESVDAYIAGMTARLARAS